MPKPTKEEMQGSKELELFNAALESLGIRPKDPKHPLAEFPPERLKNVLYTVSGVKEQSDFKHFVERTFQESGHPIAARQVATWLSDSRKIPAVQVARIVELISWAEADAHSDWALETAAGEMVLFDLFDCEVLDPYSDQVQEKLMRGIIEALFSVDSVTRARIKRLTLIADVLSMNEKELDALATVAGLADYASGKLTGNGFLNMGMEGSAQFVGELLERMDVSDECDELALWAKEWTETVNRPEPLDLPF